MNGVEFIYKEQRGTVLSEVVERLKTQFQRQFQIEKEMIEVLSNQTTNRDILMSGDDVDDSALVVGQV